jgi:hypothetical protein
MAEYPYEPVARAILSYPGMRETHAADPDWSHFAAVWGGGRRRIALDFMPDTDQFGWETGRPRWTGCRLWCDCLVGDLIDLWKAIRKKCPAVWLYDGGAFNDLRGSLLLRPRGFLRMPSLPVPAPGPGRARRAAAGGPGAKAVAAQPPHVPSDLNKR